MSFKDTFTRDSTSHHLRYDDTAFHHFLITILLIIGVPLTYSVISTILNPFKHIKGLDQLGKKRMFRDKIQRFKKEKKYSYVNFKFILKILVLIIVIYGAITSFKVIIQSKEEMKGFDPYQILEVEPDATIQKIKKSYRKLALIYHPDRNKNNPQASAKFIMISKAYECLTDQEAKQKCLKYGNPEGSASINVGIALPSFLVKKQNHILIMAIVFFLVVIILPIYLIYYHSQMNKYDQVGMLNESAPLINRELNPQFSFKDCIKCLCICSQFRQLKTTKEQIPKLKSMLWQADQDIKNTIIKKNYREYIKKALLLIDCRINQRQLAKQLQQDAKYIMKKIPIIVKSTILMSCQRSKEYYKKSQIFLGVNVIVSLILFSQHFFQGKSFEAQSYQQLDLSLEELDKISKKKKQKKFSNLHNIMNNEEDRNQFLGLLADNRASYIKECIDYLPKVQMECDIPSAADGPLPAKDFFQVHIVITAGRLSNFCLSNNYPFLKTESWYLIVSDGHSLVHQQNFSFEELTHTAKFPYIHQKPGKYSLTVRLMPDCYYGLDIEEELKYEVGAERVYEEEKSVKTVDEPEEEESMIRKLLNSMVPQDQEEVSDKEDNTDEESKKDDKQK